MPFRLKRTESNAKSLRRIIDEQFDSALTAIEHADQPLPELIHAVRRNTKMIRAALRLAQPHLGKHYKTETRAISRAAATLSQARDAQALHESFTLLTQSLPEEDSQHFYNIQQAIVYRRDQYAAQAADLPDRLHNFAQALAKSRQRIADLKLKPNSFNLLKHGLRDTYAAGRTSLATAYKKPSPDSFHELRKHTKALWYHLRILRPIWPTILTPYRNLADELGETLGHIHDLDILHQTLSTETVRFSTLPNLTELLQLISKRSHQLRAELKPSIHLLFAEKPNPFANRIHAYHRAWKQNAIPHPPAKPKPVNKPEPHATPPTPTTHQPAMHTTHQQQNPASAA